MTDDVSRRCLRKLQTICSHRRILPSSHIASGDLVKVGDYAIASTALSDVWEGRLGSTRVCIKSPKITTRDHQEIEEVSNRRWHTVSYLLKRTGILQGGGRVETVETSECCSPHRRYAEASAISVRVDAKRKLNGVPRQKSRCGSHQFGESPLQALVYKRQLSASCWM